MLFLLKKTIAALLSFLNEKRKKVIFTSLFKSQPYSIIKFCASEMNSSRTGQSPVSMINASILSSLAFSIFDRDGK